MNAPQPAAALDWLSTPLQGSCLIEAAAGTGKTWAICGLVSRLVLQAGLPIEGILVLTFTKAAQAELSERIRERLLLLRAALSAEGDAPADAAVKPLLAAAQDAETRQRWQQRCAAALAAFDQAPILTIHAWCQSVLHDAAFSAGEPLQTELLLDDRRLREQIAADFWRSHIVPGQGLAPGLLAELQRRGDEPARWARLLHEVQRWPQAQWRFAEADSPAQANETVLALQAAHQSAAAIWQQDADTITAIAMAHRDRLSHAKHFAAPRLEQGLAQWAQWLGAGGSALTPAVETATASLLGSKRFRLKARDPQPLPEHPFFAAAQSLLDLHAQWLTQLQGQRGALLGRFLRWAVPELQARKRAGRWIGYEDMLQRLHQRLQGPDSEALVSSLRKRLRAALIDEFQDTDALQWQIFQRLFVQGDAPLFLVGDPKQAIYAFRNADVHTYLAARASVQRQATLLENQRASASLLEGLNGLFSANPEFFGLQGLQFSPSALGSKPRPQLLDHSATRAALQLWRLPSGADGQALKRSEARLLAADVCATEVARLLWAAQRGEVMLDGRPLAAGDIAILVRTHREAMLMQRALAQRAVPSVSAGAADVLQSAEAADLADVLGAMLHAPQRGALHAALATRWMGWDAQRLADAMQQPEATAAMAARFVRYGQLWRSQGLASALRHWQTQEAVLPRCLGEADALRRLSNLRHAGECLQAMEAECGSPEALWAWFDAQRREHNAADESCQLRLPSDAQAVQLVTMHKSKGLQYPMVFLPFAFDETSPKPGTAGFIVWRDAEGRVLDFRPDAKGDTAVKASLDAEYSGESARLLYVALTRAVLRCTVLLGPCRGRAAKAFAQTALSRCVLPSAAVASLATRKEDAQAWADTTMQAWQAWAAQQGPAVGLDDAPEPRGDVIQPSSGAREVVIGALPLPECIPAAQRIASFSSLLAKHSDERAEREHDLLWGAPASKLPETDGAPLLDSDDILNFPRGPSAGDALHAVLERCDFSRPSTWPAAIAHGLQAHPQPGDPQALTAMLQRCLAGLSQTPLPGHWRLADLQAQDQWAEWGFHLRAPNLQPAALLRCVQSAGFEPPRIQGSALTGYLKGYVDLLYRRGGRHGLIDWKSNFLGVLPAHYGGESLREAMTEHAYHLQAMLYALALHRHLRARLQGYDFEQHFDGVLYLFVRGTRPDWQDAQGQACGVLHWRPSLQQLDALDAALEGAAA